MITSKLIMSDITYIQSIKKTKPKKYKDLLAQLTKSSDPEKKVQTEKENLAKGLGGGQFTKLVKI